MALKDYIVVTALNRACDTAYMFDTSGNKILDIYNQGGSDSGTRFMQDEPGGSLYAFAWNGSYVKYGTDGQRLAWCNMRYGENSGAWVDNVATNASGVFWEGSDPDNSFRSTIWNISPTTTLLEQRQVFDYAGSGDPLFTADHTIVSKTFIGYNDGVNDRLACVVRNDLLTVGKLISRPVSAGAWTEHTLPFDLYNTTSHVVKVGTNIAVIVVDPVVAGSPSIYIAPETTMVFDAGTSAPVTGGTIQLQGGTTEWGVVGVTGTLLFGRYDKDGQQGAWYFDTIAKTYTLIPFHNMSLEANINGVRFTISDLSQAFTQDAAVLSDGRWITHASRWTTVDNSAIASDSIVIVSSDLSSIEQPVYVSSTQSTSGAPTQTIYGIAVTQYDTYSITGTVTIGGQPASDIIVGVFNSDGTTNITTTTGANGQYTLTCLDSLPKQVVVYTPQGTSEVHCQVASTEVL